MTQPNDLVMFLAIVGMLVLAGVIIVCLDLRDERRAIAARDAEERPKRIAELERELGIGEAQEGP